MSNPEKFCIKIYFVILATEIKTNKQYVLSINEKEMQLPFIYLEQSYLEKLDSIIIESVQKLVFANEMELMPQLISLHNRFIEETNNEINCVYGFVINKTDNINNSSWISFDYLNPNKYSNLIFETIQKLK